MVSLIGLGKLIQCLQILCDYFVLTRMSRADNDLMIDFGEEGGLGSGLVLLVKGVALARVGGELLY